MQVTEKIVSPRTRYTQLLHFHDFADISQRSFVVSWCSFSMSIFADTSHMQTNFGCKPRYVKSYRGLMNPSIKKQSCRNEAEKQLVFPRRTETENMAVGEKKTSWRGGLSPFPRILPSGLFLAGLLSLGHADILGEESGKTHLLQGLVVDEASEAERGRVPDGSGLRWAAAGPDQAADVDRSEQFRELKKGIWSKAILEANPRGLEGLS